MLKSGFNVYGLDFSEKLIKFAEQIIPKEFLRPIKANTGIFMDDLFVMPESGGQGVAQKLIGAIKQYAIHNNIDIIRWITAKDNIKAINVYDKLASQTKWVTYDLGID